MKIKPTTEAATNSVLLISLSLISVVFFHCMFHCFLCTVLIAILLIPLSIRQAIAFGRTLIFSEDGITIKFIFWRQFYAWDEFSKIILFDAKNCHGYKAILKTGVEFLLPLYKRPIFLAPDAYCFYFHPFSYVYLSFSNDNHASLTPKTETYEVDKCKIFALLKMYNISLGEQG